MRSGAAERVDFTGIRYAQVWEDADVLVEALDVRPGDVCLSIGSAGDNALALLTRNPARVVAVDLSRGQIACLELRVAAYRALAYRELLELVGSRPSTRRPDLYARCRPLISPASRAIWDTRGDAIAQGIGSAGRFERYFELFRSRVLPLVHRRGVVEARLQQRPVEERRRFYRERWNTWRWRALYRMFFSRAVMGRLGRDPEFFRYVTGDVASRLLARTEHALTDLDPSENPYVHWILTGTHALALPYALREEHFDIIRQNLDRLSWQQATLEQFMNRADRHSIDAFNLSDLFEYVSLEHYHRVLHAIVAVARRGARLAYWNMLACRRRPSWMADRLVPLDALADRLHSQDRAFFYGALRIEEVQ